MSPQLGLRPGRFGRTALFTTFVLSGFAASASAQERETAEERRACTPDVFKHCSDLIPDADRITVCLPQKVRELNPECRVLIAGSKKAPGVAP
jgi:hypothetical protein